MDPDATLKEIRELLEIWKVEAFHAEEVERLAELVEALDEWLSKGGFLPKAWRPVRYRIEEQLSKD